MSTNEVTSEPTEEQKQKIVQSLEEDDEFEDFKPESECFAPVNSFWNRDLTRYLDWTEDQSIGVEGEKALWVEDWDDTDADDNFTKELRNELAKVANKK